MPTLFLIILLSSVVQPNFWWLLGITVLFGWMALVGVVRAEFLRTRNFDYIRAAQAGRERPWDHLPPYAAERRGGDTDLSAVYFVQLHHHPHLARFHGLRAAARFPSLGELLLQGKTTCRHRGWALQPFFPWRYCFRC